MAKTKLISVSLIAIMLCGISLLVAGCPGTNENQKYDVSMKIVCREVVNGDMKGEILGEWLFTPDIDEMHIEREYDGKEYFYYLLGYESKFFTNKTVWKECIEVHSALFLEGEPKENICRTVCEKGNYTLLVYAFPASYHDYNPRLLRLYISVNQVKGEDVL